MFEVGVDIVKIERIESLLAKFGNKGIARFLNDSEIKIAKDIQSLAGFWAAKEACSKALKCGIGKELGFHDMWISKDKRGAPILHLNAKKLAYFKIHSLSLSISHDGGFAVAVVAVSLKS
ncbi:holo-ACP synthase [uncultured Helicobacter sp.]|uniref:holo-ACP synthase n=1 Tax=uncultured Helicobacter sp. TaxID=175537 RepID=UPI0026113EF2|nr:holo-ACP synthase [uncultured Helicobacter sp.]